MNLAEMMQCITKTLSKFQHFVILILDIIVFGKIQYKKVFKNSHEQRRLLSIHRSELLKQALVTAVVEFLLDPGDIIQHCGLHLYIVPTDST